MDSEKKEEGGFRITDRRGQPKDEPKVEAPKVEQPAPNPPRNPLAGGVDFSAFVMSLGSAALMHMGYTEEDEPSSQKNLSAAKQEIAIIEMLEAKTQGNRTPKENQLFEQLLYELRVRFVEASKS